jgi:hypothetical protein
MNIKELNTTSKKYIVDYGYFFTSLGKLALIKTLTNPKFPIFFKEKFYTISYS